MPIMQTMAVTSLVMLVVLGKIPSIAILHVEINETAHG
jgi:hypothetical protein